MLSIEEMSLLVTLKSYSNGCDKRTLVNSTLANYIEDSTVDHRQMLVFVDNLIAGGRIFKAMNGELFLSKDGRATLVRQTFAMNKLLRTLSTLDPF